MRNTVNFFVPKKLSATGSILLPVALFRRATN
jgi:hypothetical protein